MRRHPARAALFNGYWLDMRGQRLQRVSRSELAECHRLWAKHADIRQGRAKEQLAARRVA